MSEVRDAAIKLFGRNIPVPDFHSPPEPDSAASQAAMDEMREANRGEVDTLTAKSLPSNSLQGNHIPAEDQDVPLKRPDKILPCPRCKSLDTKFCYFNNYNVNQPRHFCKNCHRYWTAGGTMRKVPVGAGRRKNKHPFRQASDVTQSEAPNSVNEQGLADASRPIQGIGKVIKFGKDVHLCESMAASLNLRDPSKMGEPSSSENELSERQMEQVGPMQAYPWNPGWSATPAPYWGWDARKWNIPMVAATASACLSPSSSASNNCSGNNSPTLRKHSRDATLQAEEKTGQSLWVPKTLRVDDPDEAAQSSIWDTLGIKPANIQPINKAALPKANPASSSDHVFQANPAALSRSQTFQENT